MKSHPLGSLLSLRSNSLRDKVAPKPSFEEPAVRGRLRVDLNYHFRSSLAPKFSFGEPAVQGRLREGLSISADSQLISHGSKLIV